MRAKNGLFVKKGVSPTILGKFSDERTYKQTKLISKDTVRLIVLNGKWYTRYWDVETTTR